MSDLLACTRPEYWRIRPLARIGESAGKDGSKRGRKYRNDTDK
jgi:hypothetical protein